MTEAERRLEIPTALGSRGRLHRARELVVHLTAREVAVRQRFTLLGAAWPLARQLAQFGVLLFIFTSVVDLGYDDYAAFLFTGLVAWNWFSGAVSQATQSLLAHRHLLLRPQCPAEVIPLAAVGVSLVDTLIAVPVLVGIVALSGELSPTALAAPLLGAIQLVLVCGLAWLTSAATVYLRDMRELVSVGLLLLFYATPVFYGIARVPEEYRWVLELNPVAALIESYRDVLLEQRLPGAGTVAALVAGSAILAGLSLALFRRLQPGFVDEL